MKKPTKSELATALARVPMFSRCSARDLRIVARHAEMVTVPAGAAVVTEGDEGDTFYLLLTGAAEVDGTTLGPGAHFGELSLLDPAPRSATVILTEDSVLAVLSVRMFRVLLRDLPQLSFGMLGSLAAQLREARRHEP